MSKIFLLYNCCYYSTILTLREDWEVAERKVQENLIFVVPNSAKTISRLLMA